MSQKMVTYKVRVNRPCRLYIDDEEVAILDELRLTKFELPEGEYLRRVVAMVFPIVVWIINTFTIFYAQHRLKLQNKE